MPYAIITVGGKQYRVQEGQTLLVDRVKGDEGATFEPPVLFVGGDGQAQLSPTSTVTARVVGHVLGEKIRIGKYKPKSGYKKHTGYRSRLSDFLNASERDFVSLTDAVVELIGHEGHGTRHEFIAVARRHIVIAIPEGIGA